MGIIQRQSIKNSIIAYLGVLIGGLSMLFIYSRDEAKEIYGYAQYLVGMAAFLLPFASLGIITLTLKYFPKFKDEENNDNGFLLILLFAYTLCFLMFGLFIFIFREGIFDFLMYIKVDKNGILRETIQYVLPLTYFYGLVILLSYQCSNYLRIVVPEIINNIGYKLWLPLAVLGFLGLYIEKSQFGWVILLFYLLAVLLLFVYTYMIGALKITKPNMQLVSENASEMKTYALFSGLNALGNSMAFRIDAIMIPLLLDFKSNGLYFIILYLATVLEKPTSAIIKIASPIISKAWENNDIPEIRMIYKKSGLNLMILGIPVFLMIWFGLSDIDAISSGKNNFSDGRYIFLLLGAAKLIDMVTSVNSQIITYSEKYKYGILFLLILGVTNIGLNIVFINKYGLIGAAIATLFSVALFNLLKLIFIKVNFDLQPFSIEVFKLLVISIPCILALHFVPSLDNPIINILKNGMIILLTYVPLVFGLKISPDLNKMIGGIFN